MLAHHLLLAGGGHAHALVLLRWAMNPKLRPKGLITLLTRNSTNIYSGMLSGVISGIYKFDECLIDLRYLAGKAGVSFINAEIIGIDTLEKRLFVEGRNPISFTTLSLDIGSDTFVDKKHLEILDPESVVPIKPFDKSLTWIEKQDIYSQNSDAPVFTVLGSGLASIEVVFALRKRWPLRKLQLQTHKKKSLSPFLKALGDQRIAVISNTHSVPMPSLLCTGNQFPHWIKESKLPLNKEGRILTDRSLQVIDLPNLFAVGDCAVVKNGYRPASGIWAVKAAEPLAKNFERLLKDKKLLTWHPQKKGLQLVGAQLSGKTSVAWALYGKFLIGPTPFFWKLKEFIDRRFMAMFLIEKMKYSSKETKMSCRGCAAKVNAKTLKAALEEVHLAQLVNNPQDAALIFDSSNEGCLLQSVDGFPALVSDPWLNGRLTALHACSDIWARGASVSSVQVLVSIPETSDKLQQELLAQSLLGVKSAIEPQGASLVGGHTFESRNECIPPISLGIELSLSANGILGSLNKPWSKEGLSDGDEILISRSLGSGIIFAAALEGAVNPKDFDDALTQLSTSQHPIIQSLQRRHTDPLDPVFVNACTDITGFGLLGHLGEMIESANKKRNMDGLCKLQIQLVAEFIPSFSGVKQLLQKNYASTLAPKNRDFFSFLAKKNNSSPQIELVLNNPLTNKKDYEICKELIIDPQTCGPLVISCGPLAATALSENNSWTKIGKVKKID